MKGVIQQFYESMLEELQHCRGKELSSMEETESCFQICVRYWLQLRERVVHYQFGTVGEEIEFFKETKPLFTSKIEYYNLLYHAVLFKPSFRSGEQQKFWQRELQRLQKFKEENAAFYAYYKSGCRGEDERFFTRQGNGITNFLDVRVYDREARASSSHDHLVASLLALEEYEKYIRKQLNKAVRND